MASSVVGSQFSARQPVPLRQWDGQHGAPDGFDSQRVELVRRRWTEQDDVQAARERDTEENIRMLGGRHWDVFVPHLGGFVDPTRYMSDAEKRWRQRPVVNVLLYWYLLTLARLTETAPVVGFQPATADRVDAMLAETMDVLFKTLWAGELEMDDRFMEAAAWLVASGEVYAETCAEYDPQAPQYQLTAPATLSMQREDGTTIERDTGEPVPYDVQGNPLAQLVADPEMEGEYGYEPMDGTPAMVTEGCPKVTIRSHLEVRAEWGAQIPWEEKRWIIVKTHLAPETVQGRYGVELQPDLTGGGAGGDATGAGVLTRMLFGAGNFGSVQNQGLGWSGNATSTAGEGFVTVMTMWEKPSAISPADEGSPGGRMLVVAPYASGGVVLHDSVRPYATKAAGPIRRAPFLLVPGRGGAGTTPLEQLKPIQKTYNRGWAQILEHRNRCTNPILIYDTNSGFADQAQNVPGAMVGADFAGLTREPAYYLAPPNLSADVWRVQDMLFNLMAKLGSIEGAEGGTPTEDPSGELISQLRFNADRPISVAAKSLASLIAGVADDLAAVLPACWPAEKVITYAGEDQILRTVTVMPELWSGNVNVRPDLQNAMGETLAAKRMQIRADWMAGAFGDPLTEGRKTYLELARYPHLNRANRVNGGPDRVTCEKMLAELIQGAPAMQYATMLQPWYNYDVFLEVTRDQLAAPEFLSYDDAVKAELSQFFQMVLEARAQSLAFQAQAVAGPAAMAQAAVQGQAASTLAATSPQPPASPDAGAASPAVGPGKGPAPASAAPPSGVQAA